MGCVPYLSLQSCRGEHLGLRLSFRLQDRDGRSPGARLPRAPLAIVRFDATPTLRTYRLLEVLQIRSCLLLAVRIITSHRQDCVQHRSRGESLLVADAVGSHDGRGMVIIWEQRWLSGRGAFWEKRRLAGTWSNKDEVAYDSESEANGCLSINFPTLRSGSGSRKGSVELRR